MRAYTGVVVITHGEAGRAMAETAARIVGRLEAVAVIGLAPSAATATICEQMQRAVAELDCRSVVFLVDLGGSTPAKLGLDMAARCGIDGSAVVSGVNLPMLLKLSTADRTEGAKVLAEELAATGAKSVHTWIP